MKILDAEFVGKFSARLGYLVDNGRKPRGTRGGAEQRVERGQQESKQETAAVAPVYAGNKILTLADNGSWVG